MSRKAKLDYEDALARYGAYSDANLNIVRKETELKQTVLENEMQLKYNTYSALNTQLQAAKAKVQERTPAFTTLQCATVPLKPDGPKRMCSRDDQAPQDFWRWQERNCSSSTIRRS